MQGYTFQLALGGATMYTMRTISEHIDITQTRLCFCFPALRCVVRPPFRESSLEHCSSIEVSHDTLSRCGISNRSEWTITACQSSDLDWSCACWRWQTCWCLLSFWPPFRLAFIARTGFLVMLPSVRRLGHCVTGRSFSSHFSSFYHPWMSGKIMVKPTAFFCSNGLYP